MKFTIKLTLFMDCSCTYSCLLLLALTLFCWNSIQLHESMAGGKLGKTSCKLAGATKLVEEEKVLWRPRIGSRPPNCKGRCSSCGHCEAVQVPAIPQAKGGKKHSYLFFTSASRKDDTNYKPMSWKCRCGDLIFNP